MFKSRWSHLARCSWPDLESVVVGTGHDTVAWELQARDDMVVVTLQHLGRPDRLHAPVHLYPVVPHKRCLQVNIFTVTHSQETQQVYSNDKARQSHCRREITWSLLLTPWAIRSASHDASWTTPETSASQLRSTKNQLTTHHDIIKNRFNVFESSATTQEPAGISLEVITNRFRCLGDLCNHPSSSLQNLTWDHNQPVHNIWHTLLLLVS